MDLNTYEASQEPLRQLARNYRRSAPCFARLALSPARTVDFKHTLRMGAAGHDAAAFIFRRSRDTSKD
jgi:hypothetical protein